MDRWRETSRKQIAWTAQRMNKLGKQYWAINAQLPLHIRKYNADEPSHPGRKPSTSNCEHTNHEHFKTTGILSDGRIR